MSLLLTDSPTRAFSSIIVDDTDIKERVPSPHAEQPINRHGGEDRDEVNSLCENKAHDNYRLCKAHTAHDSMPGKPDASLAKRSMSATEAPC